jgi:hypothetical protein
MVTTPTSSVRGESRPPVLPRRRPGPSPTAGSGYRSSHTGPLIEVTATGGRGGQRRRGPRSRVPPPGRGPLVGLDARLAVARGLPPREGFRLGGAVLGRDRPPPKSRCQEARATNPVRVSEDPVLSRDGAAAGQGTGSSSALQARSNHRRIRLVPNSPFSAERARDGPSKTPSGARPGMNATSTRATRSAPKAR